MEALKRDGFEDIEEDDDDGEEEDNKEDDEDEEEEQKACRISLACFCKAFKFLPLLFGGADSFLGCPYDFFNCPFSHHHQR